LSAGTSEKVIAHAVAEAVPTTPGVEVTSAAVGEEGTCVRVAVVLAVAAIVAVDTWVGVEVAEVVAVFVGGAVLVGVAVGVAVVQMKV
jgi:hypothetical protein